jgi:hypothetical protein
MTTTEALARRKSQVDLACDMIKVDFAGDALGSAQWLEHAYARGVCDGWQPAGDCGRQAPTLRIQALKEPDGQSRPRPRTR